MIHHCVIVDRSLDLPSGKCPLKKGQCLWQDGEAKCKYDPAITNSEEFSAATGKPVPTEDQLESFRSLLLTKL